MANLIKLLSHDDANVRRAALRAFAYTKNEDVAKSVVPLLKDKFWQVRESAVKYFEAIKYKKILPIFFGRLGTDPAKGRKVLIDILSTKSQEKETKGDNKNLEPSLPVKKAIAKAIAIIDENYLINPLIKSLGSDNTNMQLAAISALGNIGSEIAVKPIMELLDSDNLSLIIASIVALGKLKSEECVDKLIKLSAHENAQVRTEAIISLNHIKDNRAISTYIRALADSDPKVKRTAVIALGNTRDEENVDYLLGLAFDENVMIRKAVISSYVNFPNEKVIEKLIEIMDKEENEEVLLEAAVVYNKLAARLYK